MDPYIVLGIFSVGIFICYYFSTVYILSFILVLVYDIVIHRFSLFLSYSYFFFFFFFSFADLSYLKHGLLMQGVILL